MSDIKVELLHSTPLMIAIRAARKCWKSEERIDSYVKVPTQELILGKSDAGLLQKLIKMGHTSVLEHVSFNFEISGLPRAILQELARHRHASLSVESSRYCLKKLMSGDTAELLDLVGLTGDGDIDALIIETMSKLGEIMAERGSDLPNDIAKLAIPEAFCTTLIWTINARSLRNFLSLRLAPGAHFMIRELAQAVYDQIPASYRVLFLDLEGCDA